MRRLLFVLASIIAVLTFSCDTTQPDFDDSVPGVNTLTTTVSPEEGGEVFPSDGEFVEGTSIEIEAVPNAGFTFDRWEGDLVGSLNPTFLSMTQNRSVTAFFSEIEVPLTINIVGEGSVEQEIISQEQDETAAAAATVLQTEEPADTLQIKSKGDSALQLRQNDEISDDRQIDGVDSDRERQRITIPDEETEQTQIPQQQAQTQTRKAITTIRLTAIPEEGWRFSRWEGDLTGSQNPDTLVVENETIVTAVFVEEVSQLYTLELTIEGQGFIEAVPDKLEYTAGEEVTLTAVPENGWQFSEWRGDLSGSRNPETIVMDSDKEVSSVFSMEGAAELQIVQQPSQTTAGEFITPAPSVQFFDSDGNPEEGVEISAALNSQTFSGNSVVTTSTDASGVATFSELSVNTAGTDYRIEFDASDTDASSVSTNLFSVVAAAGDPESSSVSVTDGITGEPTGIEIAVDDRFGNPVSGAANEIEITVQGANSASPDAAESEEAGIYRAEYTPQNSGEDQISVSIDGSAIAGTPVVSVVTSSGAGQPSEIAIISQPTNTIAGESIAPAPAVEVTDVEGDGVEGVSVSAVLENGNFADGSTLQAVTNGSGVAEFSNLTITAAGTEYAVRFEPDASRLSDITSEQFSVTAATPDPTSTTAQVPNGSAGDQTDITITVRDEYENPVEGVASELSLSISQGVNSGASFITVTDEGNGTYQTGYTPSATGSDEIAIELNGAAINGSPFTSAVVSTDAENVVITQQPQNSVAGEVIGGTPAVLVTDSFDNEIGDVEVTVSVDGEAGITDGTLVLTTNESGVAIFDDLVIESSGSYRLRFKALGVSEDAVSEPFTVTPAAAAALVEVSGNNQTAAVNTELNDSFTVRTEDAFGNPVLGETVEFSVQNTPEGSSGTSLSAESVTTNSDGEASSTLTLGSATGDYAVAATSGIGTVPFSAFAVAGEAVSFEFDQISSPQVAGSPFVISLTAFDAEGNVAESYNGTATLETTAGSVSPGSIAFSDGEASANVRVSQAGTDRTLTAVDGDISGTSNPFDVESGGASQAVIVQQPSETTAGETISPAPSVRVEDSEGNPVDGVNVSVSAGGDAITPGSGTQATTNADGLAQFGNLVIETAGTYTLSFDVAASGVSTIQSDSFTILASDGDPDQTDASVPNGAAGEETVITITVEDAFGNRVTGAANLLSVSISGANSASPTVSEAGDGVYNAAYTPESSGTDQVAITLDGTPISRSPYSSTVSTSDISSSESSVSADPSELVVGNSSRVTIVLRDANGNAITGLSDSDFDIDVSGNGSAGSVSEISPSGTYGFNVSNNTAQQVAVSVNANGVTLDDSPQINFTPGEPDLVVITSQPQNSVAGQVISGSPAVRVTDEFGNNIPGRDVTVSEQDGQEFADGTETVSTNGSGVAQFSDLVITDAGRYNLVFTVSSSLAVTSNAFNVTPGTPDPDETSAAVPNGAAGDATNITITVQDAFENRVEGVAGQLSVSISGDNAGATVTSIQEEGNGVYSASYTPTVTGSDQVSIELNGTDIEGSPYTSNIITSDADAIVILQDALQTVAGESIEGPPSIEVQDDLGNPVSNVEVVVSLEGSASFDDGNTTRSTNGDGIAVFNNLVIETAGSYTLIFNAIGVSENVSSGPFNVVAANAETISRDAGNNQSGTVTTALNDPFVVRVADRFGNPVSGTTVDFSITETPSGASGQTLSSNSVTTDADGLASTTLTLGDIAGAYAVAASASGVGSVTFNATANAAAASSFSFDQVNSPQTAGQPFGIRIVALDSEGNVASDYQGTADLEAANGSISPGEADFTNGSVSLDVSLATAATGQSITANDGSISGTSNTFDVQSGGVSAANSSVTADPASQSAGLSSTLTIELRDGSNNPVTVPAGDISIAVSGDATSGSLSGSGNTYTSDITNQTAETVTVTVSVNSVTLNDTPSIEFTPAGADALTIVSGNNQSGPVTEQLSSDFVVRVADAFDNSVQGVDVEFNIVSAPGGATGQSLSSTTVQTNVSGEASTRLTLGDTPGEYTVEASVSGVGTVTFTADAETGAATQMEIVTQPENTRAGQAISPSPQLRVTDSAGNGVGGVSITVREDGGYNFDAGTLTQVTSASGVAVFDDLIIESSGRYTLVFDASVSSVPSVSSNAININPGQGDADNTTATVPDGTAGETTEITIEVEDEFNNPVGGAAEELSVEISGANSASPSVSETAVTGTYAANYTPTAAGTDFFLIEIRGTEISGNPYSSSVSTSGISSSESSVVASPTSLTVGNSSTVSVLLRDEVGNAIAGLAGTDFTVTASGDATVGTVNETSTDGTYQFNVRNTTAQTVSVSVEVSGVALDDNPEIVFQPAAPADFIITINPGDAVAGTVIPGPPSVLIEDRFENPVPGVSVIVTEQSGESFASGTATIQTNATGVAAFDDLRINAAGQYNLVFSSSGLNNQTSNAFDITAAAADAAQTTASVPNGAAGAATTITVSVNDAYGNPVTGAAGDLAATVSGANTATISTFTGTGDGTYTASYTPTSTGNDTIAITLGGAAIQGSPFTSNVTTSGAANVDVATQPLSTVAGQPIAGPPTAEVTDSESNPVPGVDVVASLNSGSFASGQTTVSTDENGQSAFSNLIITTAGSYVIDFSAQGVSESVSTQSFDVTPAAASAVTIDTGNNQSGTVGEALTDPFAVLVADEFGNSVEGEEVTFAISSVPTGSTGSSLTETTVLTNTSGLASTVLTFGSVAGTYEVTATVDGLDTVTFTATATAGSVSTFAFDSITSPQTAGSSFEISIDALDGSGNIVTDYSGTASLTSSAGSITPNSATFANGEVVLNVSVSNAGAGQTITAEDGSITGTSNTFDVQSGGVDAGNSLVSASPLTLQAGQSSTLTIELRDGSNNIVAGVDAASFGISLTGDATAGTITEPTAGTYTADIINQTAETVTATVTANGTELNETPQIEFTPADADPAATTANVPNGAAGDATGITISVDDEFGNPVSDSADALGISVTSGPNAGAAFTTITSNGDGTYTTSYTPQTIGTDEITITLSGTEIAGSPYSSTVTTSDVSASNSSATANPTSLTVGSPSTVTVELRDGSNNPIAGLSSTDFNVSANGSATTSAVSEITAGTYEFTVSNQVAESVTVTVTATGTTLQDTPAIEFTVGETATITVTNQPGDITAGQSIAGPPTVTLEDEFDNPVPGINVTVSEQGGQTFDSGTLTVQTDASGIAAFSDLVLSSAGQYNLVFNEPGGKTATSNVFDVNAAAGNAAQSSATVPNGAAGDATSININVSDEFGNPVTGAGSALDVSVTGGPNAGESFSGITDNGDGTYTTSYTPLTIGTDEITITLNSVEISGSPYSSTVTTSDVSASNSSATASPTSLTVGSPSTVTVVLRDGTDNPITGLTSSNFDVNPSGSATASTVTETPTAGTYQFTVSNQTAESVTVTISATGTTINDEPVITFSAGVPERLIVSTQPLNVTAGESIPGPPSVTLEDQFTNPVPSVDVTVSEQGGQPFAGGTLTVQTNASGAADFTDLVIADAGEYNLVFTATGGETATSNVFEVSPADGDASQTTATVPNGSAGDATTITVSVNDAFGNPVTGAAGDLAATVSGANTATISTFTGTGNGSYTASYTPTATGDDTIAITLGGAAIQGSPFTSTVITSDAAAVAVAAEPLQTVAGQPVAGPPAALVTDDLSNPVSGIDVVASLTSGSFASGTSTVSSDGSGESVFNDLVITQAGSYAINFNAQGVTDAATTTIFDVIPAAASDLVIDSGNNQTATVNNTLANPFTVQVSDEFGNVVEGESISFTISDAPAGATGQSLSATTVQTDADGLATTSLALGNVSGDYSVTASGTGLGSVVFTATANAGAASQFVFDTIASPQTAGSGFTISLTAQDSEGNTASNYSGTATLTTTAGTITPATADFASGIASVNVTVSNAGTGQTITAEDGLITGTSNTFDVASGGIDASNSLVTASPLTLQAGQSSTLTIELRDGSNNPVDGVDAGSFTIALTGDATAGAITETTAGTYTSAITNQTAETITATVTVSGTQLNDIPQIEYTAGSLAALTLLSGDNQTGTVAEQLPSDFVVKAEDSFGNPVSGVQVSFAIDQVPAGATGQSLTNTQILTGSLGRAFTRLTLGNLPGTYTVVASAAGVGSVTFSAQAEIGEASVMSVTTQPGETTAGNAVTPAPEVTVTDNAGNPIDGVTVSVTEQGGYLFDGGTLSALTDTDGTAAFNDLVINTADNYTLVFDADAPAVSDLSSNPFDVVAAAGDPLNSAANVPDGAAGDPTTITISVWDQFNNPVTGLNGDLVISFVAGPNSTSSFSTIIDNGNGTYTTSYTPTATGTDEISITLNGANIAGTTYFSTVATSDVSTSNSSVSASPETLPAGSNSLVTVEVRDGSNNLISDLVSSDFSISVSGDGSAGTISESSTDGIYQFNVSNTTSEQVSVSVTATGTTLLDSPTITFTAAAADLMLITQQPQTSEAGQPIAGPPTAQITDEYGNRVPNVEVTISEQGGQSFAVGSTATLNTNSLGQAIFDNIAIEPAGDYNLVFSVDGITNRTSNLFEVTESDPNAAQTTASVPNGSAGVRTQISITVRDAFGNRVEGASSLIGVQVSGANDGSSLEGILDNDDGVYSTAYTPSSTGTDLVAIDIDGAAIPGSPFSSEVTTSDADNVVLNQQPLETVAGNTIAGPPSVTVTDQFGNNVSGIEVTVRESGGADFDSGNLIATTDVNGVALFSDLQINTAGSYTLVFDAVGVELDATSGPFNVVPAAGDAGSTIASVSGGTAGEATTITVTVQDIYGNGVEGAQGDISISVTSGANTGAGVSSVVDQGSGIYTATYTPTVTGTDTLTVTLSTVAISNSPVSNVVSAGPASTLEISQQPTTTGAGSLMSPSPTTTVRDSEGNGVPGVDVTATLSTNNFTTASTVTVTTDNDGIATFGDLTIETASTGYTITFGTDAAGVADVTSNSFDITAATASGIESVSGDGQTANISTQLTDPFVVRVVDDFGNPIAGEDVSFSISDSPAGAAGESITNLTATSDSNGLASTTLTLGDTAGTYTVNALFNGVTIIFTAEATNPI